MPVNPARLAEGAAYDPGAYPLGHSDRELTRLALQSDLFAAITADMLHRAGIRAGMHVLDVGCGAGDVSLLAAQIVGPTGRVLGIDRSQRAVEAARHRAHAVGCGWLGFEAADLGAFGAGDRFDAVTGRFILGYMPEPAKVLRRLAELLRPGGVVAFAEMDVGSAGAVPELALYNQCRRWVLEAYRRAGVEANMGSRLLPVFAEAGLTGASALETSRTVEGPNTPAYAYFAETIRSLLPAIVSMGLATAAEVDVDTLADRLRRKAVRGRRRVVLPRVVTAWARAT